MTNPKEELHNYLERLISRLLYIKGINKQLKLLEEWEIPSRIIAIEIGSYFFRLVSFSFNRTLLIELYLLLDDREAKGIIDFLNKAHEHAQAVEPSNYNSETGKREIISVNEYRKIIQKQREMLNSQKSIIENIKERRDKSLAHSDAKYFNKPENIYIKFPLSNNDIETIIEVATEILRMQNIYLFESDLDIQVHATSNVDTILTNTRGFNRLWFDKRATDLLPGLYRVDDFEEELSKLKNT
jgi:AbiU2